MNPLQINRSGPVVLALQKQLLKSGHAPGACDGIFGPATKAALIAFQRSAALPANGVADQPTLAALAQTLSRVPPSDDPMPLITVDMVAKMFPYAHIDNIKANLPGVLHALEAAKQTSVCMVLATLATIAAETAGFQPINEMQSSFNTSAGGHPFDLYDHRKELGNLGGNDGARFRGRGYVQLTGRSNYMQYGPMAGQPDMVDTPECANDPDTAASVLAAFIKARSAAISAALQRDDFAAARQHVNGGEHGLEAFTHAYRTGMTLLAATSAITS